MVMEGVEAIQVFKELNYRPSTSDAQLDFWKLLEGGDEIARTNILPPDHPYFKGGRGVRYIVSKSFENNLL